MRITDLSFSGADHLNSDMLEDFQAIVENSPIPLAGPGGEGAPIVRSHKVVINGVAAAGEASRFDFEPVEDDQVDTDLEDKPYKIAALAMILRLEAYFGEDDLVRDDYDITPETYPELFAFYESLFGTYAPNSVTYVDDLDDADEDPYEDEDERDSFDDEDNF